MPTVMPSETTALTVAASIRLDHGDNAVAEAQRRLFEAASRHDDQHRLLMLDVCSILICDGGGRSSR